MSQVKVETIVIKIGKKELQLNLEEAKELLNVLEDVLGKKVEVVERIIERNHWRYWDIQPYTIIYDENNTGTFPKYPNGTILCSVNR